MYSAIMFFKNAISCYETLRKTSVIKNLPFKEMTLRNYQSLSRNFFHKVSSLFKQDRHIQNKINNKIPLKSAK